jgi:hypothetical protein
MSLRVLSEPAFVAALAAELERDPAEVVSSATLADSLGCDDVSLVRVVILLEGLASDPRIEEIDWDELTVHDLYKFYVAEAMRSMLGMGRQARRAP